MGRRRKRITLLLACSILLGTMRPADINHAAENMDWNYQYTGKEQVFTAPYTGIYQVELYGAQGGGENGGKGGGMTVTVSLEKGTKVSVYAGGQDGYNGGGTGSATNGGGATDIRVNGKRIAIAAGGGGATAILQGGEGGSGGDNGKDYIGSSDIDRRGAAGGGGGYKGGISGYYYTEMVTPHSHSDSCYGFCTGTVTYGDANNDGRSIGSCNKCGTEFVNDDQQPGMHPEPHTCNNRVLICTKSTTPELQVFSKASSGGSNWYDPDQCSAGTGSAGVREGNGECRISLKAVYRLFYRNTACKNVYYSGKKVKRVYYNGNLVYME